MRFALATSACVLLVIPAFRASANAAPQEAVTARSWPLQLPAEKLSPGAAQAISAGALAVGVAIGSAMMVSAGTSGNRPQLPGAVVTGVAFVLTPSLGRWLAGESSSAAQLTLTRLLLGAAAGGALAAGVNSDSAFGYSIGGVLASVVLVHSIFDVVTTRRDILLDRAVRIYTAPPSDARTPLPAHSLM